MDPLCTLQSTHTSSSVAAARARAKGEAAKAQLTYIEKEATILKKKAHLEADLYLLKSKKEVAAAVAEAEAWESSMQENGDPPRPQLHSMPPVDPEQRTQEYRQQQTELINKLQTLHLQTPKPAPPLVQPTRNNNETLES
ncbi:hypothetical protein XENORESO_006705 [Xenotaenia resolanae]|uniref:Uncharacterized protein n=1 Tax=Xenotaenia resolanae TaxID=208358 RepID=A0ABV0WE25_9TELE